MRHLTRLHGVIAAAVPRPHLCGDRRCFAVKPAGDVMSGAELRQAAAAKRTSDAASSALVRRSLLQSFQASMPTLLKDGDAVMSALQMPLGDQAEKPMKDLLLTVARRLRGQAPQGAEAPPELAPSELPWLLVLFHKLRFIDDVVFEDFLVACCKHWPGLTASDLQVLLKSTEDYTLLHPSKGTALVRLAAALRTSLRSSLPPAHALANLSYAALGIRSRMQCMELLELLAESLRGAAPDENARLLLRATSELQAAGFTVDETQLKKLAEAVASQEAVPTLEETCGDIKCCGLLWWSSPAALDLLMESIASKILEGGLDPQGQLAKACGRLPLQLRARLLDRMYPANADLSLQEAQMVLSLSYDRPDSDEHDRLKRAVEKVVSEHKELTHGTPALARAYVAAASAGEPLKSSADAALMSLDVSRLQPQDVQVLFRCKDNGPHLWNHFRQHFESMQDVLSQVSALQGAATLEQRSDLWSACEVVRRRVREINSPTQLAVIESALRRGPLLETEPEAAGKLLARVRKRVFRCTLAAPEAWSSKPARGYMEYVERSTKRGRVGRKSDPPTVKEAPSVKPARQAKELVQWQPADHHGVQWHAGVQAWEARCNVRGQHKLGGYFKPVNDSEEEIEHARLLAEEHAESMERHYLAPRTMS